MPSSRYATDEMFLPLEHWISEVELGGLKLKYIEEREGKNFVRFGCWYAPDENNIFKYYSDYKSGDLFWHLS